MHTMSCPVSLPLAEDPHDRYSHLFEYASDDSRLIVLPFEALFPSHASVMAGIADYRWRDRDGSEHRILTTNRDDVRSAVTNAKAPPSKRPSRGPIRDNPDFPPPVLPLPPKPRAETWRASAAAYLAARNALPDADSEADDLAWIDAVRRIDPVAARHITDMRNLFLLGQDPRKSAEPRGMAVMADLNAVAAEHDPEARVVAGDFRLAAPGEDFGSLSLRVLRGDLDAVVGPHYTYQTLVFALRETLTHGSGKGNDSPTPDDRSA
jgi:hypothetical protein